MSDEDLTTRDLPSTWEEIDLGVLAEIGKETTERISQVSEVDLPTARAIGSVV